MSFRSLATVVTVFLLAISPRLATCQAVGDDPGEDRRVRIAENLKLRFDQLREAQVVVTDLATAEVDGFDIGTVLINGRNNMRFLVTHDDTHLYFLAADAVDVSLSMEEVGEEFRRIEREELAEARERHEELMVLSKGMPSRGKADAPVTVVEFSDFECPYCARVVPTVKQLLEKYPDDVRVVFMHLPLAMHPWAEPAAVAAECAARQSEDAFWALHDFYFGNQANVSTDNVVDKSRQQLSGFGINIDAWNQCAADHDSETYKNALSSVRSSAETAKKYGATGTPTFFVNGRYLSGAQPLSAFDELIKDVLAEDA